MFRLRKRLEPKWFYDAEGSRLSDEICALEAYCPTRTEAAILRDAAEEIAAELGPRAVLYKPARGP